MKEYGSNAQKLVDYILQIEDKDKRNRFAYIMVELMRQIHPNMRDTNQDYAKKLWDDLYIMSDFNLEVDSPYPAPSKDILGKKPDKVEYNLSNIKFKHYGKNVNLLIERAIQVEEAEVRIVHVGYIAKLMKSFYTLWNREVVDDEVIWLDLLTLSGGKLGKEVEQLRSGQDTLGKLHNGGSPRNHNNQNHNKSVNRNNNNNSKNNLKRNNFKRKNTAK